MISERREYIVNNQKSVKVDQKVKPSIIKSARLSKEDHYVAQQEEKLIKEHTKRLQKEKEEKDTKRLEEEKKKARELHYMKCPKCGMDLEEITFMDILVDICNECKGLWLDKGELESIMIKEAGFFVKLFNKIGLMKVKSPLEEKD